MTDAINVDITDIPISKTDEDKRLVFGWANVPLPGVAVSKNLIAGSDEERLRQVAVAYQEQFETDEGWAWVVATFDDVVFANVEEGGRSTYWRHAYTQDGESVAFGRGVEVEQVFVEKSLAMEHLDDTVVNSVTDEALAIVGKTLLDDVISKLKETGEKTDLQGDVLPLADLEKSAYDFNLSTRAGGVEHARTEDGPVVVSSLVESFFATTEKYVEMGVPEDIAKTLNQGWWIGFKVADDEVWAGIKDGTYSMFSVHGTASGTQI